MAFSADEFWNFSLEFYGRPGVEQACLALQNRRNADVNLLLLGVWLATQGAELAGTLLSDLDSGLAPWRNSIVTPLRQIRRQLPRFVGAIADEPRNSVKRAIKDAEQEAERAAQSKMIELINKANLRTSAGDPKVYAGVSLRLYLRRLVPAMEPQDKADIEALLAAM